MAIETSSLGTRVRYGRITRPETNAGVTNSTGTEKVIEVQTTGVASEWAYVPYWPNTKYVRMVGNQTVPTGLTMGIYSVNAAGVLTQLTAPVAFAAAAFTTATTGADARVAGEMAAGVTGYMLGFTAATTAGRIAFEVDTNVISPKTLAATR